MQKYVGMKVCYWILAAASFLSGILLFLTGHPWGGTLLLLTSVTGSVLIALGFKDRQNDAQESEPAPAEQRPPEKPRRPANYKDLN